MRTCPCQFPVSALKLFFISYMIKSKLFLQCPSRLRDTLGYHFGGISGWSPLHRPHVNNDELLSLLHTLHAASHLPTHLCSQVSPAWKACPSGRSLNCPHGSSHGSLLPLQVHLRPRLSFTTIKCNITTLTMVS